MQEKITKRKKEKQQRSEQKMLNRQEKDSIDKKKIKRISCQVKPGHAVATAQRRT